MNSSEKPKGLLRFLTAGSVDDGKSTLIGRLLYEAGGVYEDQLHSVRKASKQGEELDLSLITDGLKAEREQAITIDVAYRYFSTAKRKFIIADTPGHEQYTRNMVTGASTADAVVLLVDACKGLLEQTRRHLYILWLLGIRHVILAVNKMDLVHYDQDRFIEIQCAFADSTAFMPGARTYFIPLSARKGDNVVRSSEAMTWYSGPTLLELLESIPAGNNCGCDHLRFPIQNVIRLSTDFRGYAGQMVAGILRPGQEAVALPSGQRTRVKQVMLYKQLLEEAVAPQSVVVTLEDQIDLGRGDMLVDPERAPIVSNKFFADLIWMSERPLKKNVPYLIKHATQVLCCSVREVFHKIDVSRFEPTETSSLVFNELGRVSIEAHKPMFFDPYAANHTMGSFIMIDPACNDTVAAGLISERSATLIEDARVGDIRPMAGLDFPGLTLWFTGLSGAGKTTLCNSVSTELLARGFKVEILDGDTVRKSLNCDLGFSRQDRDENIRRIGFVAELLSRHGVIVLVAAISPYRAVRAELRKSIPNFMEIYVNAPLAICEQRDPKGLYHRARKREITGFTGIDDPYEPPQAPDVECATDWETVKTSTNKVISMVSEFLAARIGKQRLQSRLDDGPAAQSALGHEKHTSPDFGGLFPNGD